MSDNGVQITSDFSILENMISALKKNHYVDVGILGENAGKTEKGATLGLIGSVHEFGSPSRGIPKRSFILMPIQTRQEQIEKAVTPRFAEHLRKGDIHGIFVDIGIAAESQIQDAFDTGGFGSWPKDKPATKARKDSESILIDTGALRKAITSEAKES